MLNLIQNIKLLKENSKRFQKLEDKYSDLYDEDIILYREIELTLRNSIIYSYITCWDNIRSNLQDYLCKNILEINDPWELILEANNQGFLYKIENWNEYYQIRNECIVNSENFNINELFDILKDFIIDVNHLTDAFKYYWDTYEPSN